MTDKKKSERGRPFSVMLDPNENLPFMKVLYKKFDGNIEDILSFLDITNQTLWRWNTGKSKPRMKKHMAMLEEKTGYSANDIKMQYLLLDKKRL